MRRVIVLWVITLIWLSGCTERPDIPPDPSWTVQTVESEADVGGLPCLAVDSRDHPRVSYADYTNRKLKYAAWDGSSWDTQTVDGASLGLSLALDSSDYAHIAYYDGPHRHLKYAAWNGSSWDIQTVESVHFADMSGSLALDSSGYPHISHNYFYVGKLRYATWNRSSWDTQTVDSPHVGFSCSLDLDGSDHPHISYNGEYLDEQNEGAPCLKYATWDGSSWEIQTVYKGDQGGLFITCLRLDGSGYPHIAYQHTHNGLRYAAWDGSSWDIQTVGSARAAGDVSLALDSSNYAHISYCDYPDHNLKYAVWNGSSWDIETVDNGRGIVSAQNSLALDSNDYAHIAYLDYTNNNLKYATNRAKASGATE